MRVINWARGRGGKALLARHKWSHGTVTYRIVMAEETLFFAF